MAAASSPWTTSRSPAGTSLRAGRVAAGGKRVPLPRPLRGSGTDLARRQHATHRLGLGGDLRELPAERDRLLRDRPRGDRPAARPPGQPRARCGDGRARSRARARDRPEHRVPAGAPLPAGRGVAPGRHGRVRPGVSGRPGAAAASLEARRRPLRRRWRAGPAQRRLVRRPTRRRARDHELGLGRDRAGRREPGVVLWARAVARALSAPQGAGGGRVRGRAGGVPGSGCGTPGLLHPRAGRSPSPGPRQPSFLFPLSVLYAIVRLELFEAERFIRFTLGYAVASAALALAYAGGLTALERAVAPGFATGPPAPSSPCSGSRSASTPSAGRCSARSIVISTAP